MKNFHIRCLDAPREKQFLEEIEELPVEEKRRLGSCAMQDWARSERAAREKRETIHGCRLARPPQPEAPGWRENAHVIA